MSAVVRLTAALFAFLGTALLAQAPVRDRAPGSLSGSSAIHGRVVSPAGDPLRHARVSMTAGTGTIAPVLSDGDGRFSFRELRAGKYTVSAVKAGFAKATAQ